VKTMPISLAYPRDIHNNLLYRINLIEKARNDLMLQSEIREVSKRDIIFWINTFCQTKDPRKVPDILPFICYPYQEETILQVQEAIDKKTDLLIEKSRDAGASWIILYVFTHKWLFEKGSDFRVGSRKEEYVDKLNDIDTLLEKIRFNIKRLPTWMLPKNFNYDDHLGYMRILNPENGNAILGESANPSFGSGGRRKAILLDEFSKWDNTIAEAAWTACYSKDTEALTKDGWKLIKDIKINDFVYSMDIKTRKARFMPVLKTYEQKRDKLIKFQGKLIDLLVTENHKIIYETKSKIKNIFFKDAKRVMDMRSGSIPLISKNANTYNPKTIYGFPAGEWMEFLGWYISEGCTVKSGTIVITQSIKANPNKVNRIKNLLFHLGLKYSYNGPKDFNVNVRGINKKARQELESLGKCHEKYIPKKYFSMRKSLLLRLYQGLMLGDGCDRVRVGEENATAYTTVSRALASDAQALAQLIGYKASIRNRQEDKDTALIMGRKIKSDIRLCYDVFVGYKIKANIEKLTKSYVEYNDKVYCVETKHHTLYVRRNGIACWCGNTADVTPCRIVCSTPLGSGNKFAILAAGTKEKIAKITLHWTLHPEKGKDAYYLDNNVKVPIGDCKQAFALWKMGVKVRSPWYDAEAERRSAADLAQEVDIDYLRAGYPFFDLTALAKQFAYEEIVLSKPMDPIPSGRYIRVNLVEVDNKVSGRPLKDGWLKIFERPVPGSQYVNSGDTAEGLAKGDECFGVVRNKWTRHIAATYNGIWDPDDFALKMWLVEKYYKARTAPENNNHGFSVCSDLFQWGSNLYFSTVERMQEGKVVEVVTKKGFSTTAVTRPQMLDQMEEEIRKGAFELRDPVLIAQAKTFIKNQKTGKPEADGSFLDDGILACAIGGLVIQKEPYKAPKDKNIEIPKPAKNAGFSFKGDK